MAKKPTHVHKYERRRLGSWKKSGHEIYRCAIPGCTHYMVDMELAVGKYSKCWGLDCTNDVEMTRYLVFNEKRKHPLCEECKRAKRLAKMTPEERAAELSKDERIDRFFELLEEEDEPIDA